MEVGKMPRRLARAAAIVATAAAGLAAVPIASAHAIPLRVGPAGITHIGMPGVRSSGLAGTTVESTNWSGYALNGGTYTSVTTTWTQPSVNCSQTPNSYAAFWAGLDGYSSSTVEQDGTLAECVSSGGRHGSTQTAEYFGWYETYPNPMYQFGGTVKPGDVITSTVTANSSTSFTLVLADATEGWSKTTKQTLRKAAALSSAEVIAEAPSSNSGVLPLADFGTMSFLSSSVTGSSAIGIDMITSRGAAEATPGPLGGNGGFADTWNS
jgi:Peptidase A4 family